MVKLDPLLKGIRSNLFKETYTCDIKVGNLCAEWAKKLGLPESVTIGAGSFDAHLGAVGGEIRPYYMSKVMGTSTCDMLVAPMNEAGEKLVRGICGQVEGSILPGMLGLEAGQSAFGDIYAWFRDLLLWPMREVLAASKSIDAATRAKLLDEAEDKTIRLLSDAAERCRSIRGTRAGLDERGGVRRMPISC